jgi:hypothetical protein
MKIIRGQDDAPVHFVFSNLGNSSSRKCSSSLRAYPSWIALLQVDCEARTTKMHSSHGWLAHTHTKKIVQTSSLFSKTETSKAYKLASKVPRVSRVKNVRKKTGFSKNCKAWWLRER